MKPVMSVEELNSLPERGSVRYKREQQPDGSFINVPFFLEMVQVDFENKMILAFIDKDGREMLIGYDEQGAYKYPTKKGR